MRFSPGTSRDLSPHQPELHHQGYGGPMRTNLTAHVVLTDVCSGGVRSSPQ